MLEFKLFKEMLNESSIIEKIFKKLICLFRKALTANSLAAFITKHDFPDPPKAL